MMSNNITSIFNRYSVPKRPPPPTAPLPDGQKQDYIAAEISSRPVDRLRIHYNNGRVELIRYLAIGKIVSVKETALAFATDTGGVFLDGHHLRQLMNDFQDGTIRSLTYFDSNIHRPPAEGAPIIHHIYWQSAEQLIAERDS